MAFENSERPLYEIKATLFKGLAHPTEFGAWKFLPALARHLSQI